MEFVGEALRDHMAISSMGSQVPCVALGIAVWGCVANNLALDGEGEKGLWPATYAIEDVIHPPRGMASLDPNHTHFLLVDDGREKVFGAEIPLRSELEHYISAVGTTGVAQGQTIPTPVVLIVVEGGVNTMETVFQSNKRNTPVVVINGSGRAADIIALAFKLTADPANPDRSKFLPDFEDIMREAVTRTFVWKAHDKDKERKIQNCIDNTRAALMRRNLLKDLYDAMFTALVQNRTDFVQLFMDTGVDLKKFLNIKTLWNLYCNCLNVEDDGEASILRNIITYTSQGWGEYLRLKPLEEWRDFPKEGILHCINKIIIHLLKDESFDFYLDEKYCVRGEESSMGWKGDRSVIQPLLERISSKNKDNFTSRATSHGTNTNQSQASQDGGLHFGALAGHSRSSRVKHRLKMKEVHDFDQPERDLFIFAVLFNRRQLADLFLHQGTDHLGMSLFGSSLLKALADKADMDEEDSVSLDLMQHSQSMELVAKSVLDECYARSRLDAHLLLTRQIKQLGNMTILLHVDRQHLMEFAEHSACQTKLSSIWKGSLSLHTSEFKVFMTLLLPFLIVFMKFDKGKSRLGFEQEDDTDQPEQPCQGNGNITNDEKMDVNTPRFAQSQNLPEDKTKRTQFREVRVMNCNNRQGLNPFRAFYTFYKAPVTKFMANIMSYLIFLAMFSYFLLTNIKPVSEPNSPSALEILVWIWYLTLVSEEIRQIMIRDQRSLKYKLRNWWSNFWNQFDLLMYSCMVVSIVLRYSMDEADFVYVRCVYSVTLAMTYLRFMQFFFAEKNMGPKVIMIRRMLTDLMFFFLILAVFVLSFGVAYHVNMFPNSPVSWSILKNVIYYPYFQIYGELFLEDLEQGGEGDCTTNRTIWLDDPSKRCPEENAIVPVMLALYMILTNILLVNLLIAMFSYTFQTVQDNSTKVWRFYRISLVNEYFDRPTLVPPVIVLNHIWRFMRYCLAIKGEATKRHNAFSKKLSADTNQRLTLLEKAAMDMYLATSSIRQNELLDNRVANTAERLDKVMGDLQRIKESVMQQELDRAAEADKAAAIMDAAISGDCNTPGASDSMKRKHGLGVSAKKSDKETSSLKEQIKELNTQSADTKAQLAEVTAMLHTLLAQRK
ncbi:transient receptor potential cation channel subfamily M member 3 [Elysia marginata]|uniref:Transient receptor potential cation channel subfamily M member 3 n=1 Tax=Elysia marginata TaxID=1093978 RepID=A0AAV4IYZ9_9GAST|nr:transient receptor potential cation channel subfamily M member 3 [Elysia marginata]